MTAGEVVLLDFPYSDLSGSKLRPAVVLATAGSDDFIACQVTSQMRADAIELTSAAFSAGGLSRISYARPGKPFTAHRRVIVKRVARITEATRKAIADMLIDVLRRGHI
jgi:mRNA interferase MazF